MSEEVQLKVRIEQPLKRLVDADERANKEVVRAALWREFGGERRAAVDVRIEHKLNRVETIEAELNDLRRERDERVEELESLRSRRDELESSAMAKDAFIADLLDRLAAGEFSHLTVDVIRATDESDAIGESAQMIHEALVEAAAEDERPFYNTHFMDKQDAQRKVRNDEQYILGDAGGETDG